MAELTTSILLHCDSPMKALKRTIQSITKEARADIEFVLMHTQENSALEKEIGALLSKAGKLQWVYSADDKPGYLLTKAFHKANAPFILYINNRQAAVTLKQGAIDLFLLVMSRHPQAGMLYSDYERLVKSGREEIHLLKHHHGRVRDNQDYGKVFFFRKNALEAVGYASTLLRFSALYDLRFRLSEKYQLMHIANRYAGSLYQVETASKNHNVFDYLLASKESQQEAERVLTNHLKRIGAYLKAGAYYRERPESSPKAELKASVIIPVNNRPEFIGTAIESVQAQTVGQVEAVIVVNGGPEDPTVAEVQRYMKGGDKYDAHKPQVQLLVYEINNLGLCLNMGAAVARGEYYVQLDSDDRLKPEAVEKILKVFKSDPKIGIVIGSYEVWQLDENGHYSRMEELPVVTHDEWTEENGRNNLLRINGAGAPRSIPIRLIRQIGFSMNEEPYARNYGEDYGMVLRISEQHRIGRVWDAIYEVVRHSGGTDHSIDQATIDRNDEAKDFMRAEAIIRRIQLNRKNEPKK